MNSATRPTSDAVIEIPGVVLQALRGGLCRVEIPGGRQVLARIVGRLRSGFVRIAAGSRVTVELSAFDFNRARIVGVLA